MVIRLVHLCDLCYMDGVEKTAEASYQADDGQVYFVCRQCQELVEEAGFDCMVRVWEDSLAGG